MKRQEHLGWFGLALAGGAALLFWLLHKNGLLHERVTSRIVTGAGTVASDSVTGAPQFDLNDARTYDAAKFQQAVLSPCAPHCGSLADCPVGWELWFEISQGKYYCFPIGG